MAKTIVIKFSVVHGSGDLVVYSGGSKTLVHASSGTEVTFAEGDSFDLQDGEVMFEYPDGSMHKIKAPSRLQIVTELPTAPSFWHLLWGEFWYLVNPFAPEPPSAPGGGGVEG